MKLTDDQVAQLLDDETVNIGDRFALELKFEYDDLTTINDFDCYGRVSFNTRKNWYSNTGSRPEDFDGMAEIIDWRDGRAWWQPPTDCRDQWYSDPKFRSSLRQQVRDILDYGFQTVFLNLIETCDHCGTRRTIDFAVLSGIEPLLDSNLMSVYVHDLAADLQLEETTN